MGLCYEMCRYLLQGSHGYNMVYYGLLWFNHGSYGIIWHDHELIPWYLIILVFDEMCVHLLQGIASREGLEISKDAKSFVKKRTSWQLSPGSLSCGFCPSDFLHRKTHPKLTQTLLVPIHTLKQQLRLCAKNRSTNSPNILL